MVWTAVVLNWTDSMMAILFSVRLIEITSHNPVIVDSTPAIFPSNLNLVFKHWVNGVGGESCSSLSNEILFLSLEFVHRNHSTLLNKIFEDAGTRQCIVVIYSLEINGLELISLLFKGNILDIFCHYAAFGPYFASLRGWLLFHLRNRVVADF